MILPMNLASREHATLDEVLEVLASEDAASRLRVAKWFPAIVSTPLRELVLIVWGKNRADSIENGLRRAYGVRLRKTKTVILKVGTGGVGKSGSA